VGVLVMTREANGKGIKQKKLKRKRKKTKGNVGEQMLAGDNTEASQPQQPRAVAMPPPILPLPPPPPPFPCHRGAPRRSLGASLCPRGGAGPPRRRGGGGGGGPPRLVCAPCCRALKDIRGAWARDLRALVLCYHFSGHLVCMYVCIYVCMYIHTYVYTCFYVCIYVYTYV